jgi:hypothetical protein
LEAIFYLAVIGLHAVVALLGVISITYVSIRHQLVSLPWALAALLTAIVWIGVLLRFGMYPATDALIAGAERLVAGLLGPVNPLTFIGVFAFLFATRARVLVGISGGFALSAVRWLWHVVSAV